MTTNNTTITNINNEPSDNDFLSEVINSIVDEAVRHFNSIRKRSRDDDERYFFNKEEVEAVMVRLNDPNSVKCTEELNDDGSVFCYVLNFNTFTRESRNRTKRASA